MRRKYVLANVLLLLSLLLAVETWGDQNYPILSKRIPYFMERLQSNRWKVRYCLLHDLTRRDHETKQALETLILDENRRIGNQALVRYLISFVIIDKTLFSPELYLWGKLGASNAIILPDQDHYYNLVEYLLGRSNEIVSGKTFTGGPYASLYRLDTTRVDDPSICQTLTTIGILGKLSDARMLYPYLQSSNDYVLMTTAKALIRIGDKKKGMEALEGLAMNEQNGHTHYSAEALYALKEVQHPELEKIANRVLLSAVNNNEELRPNELNAVLLAVANATGKDVWNLK
jgi:hypothetical protein